MDDDFLLSTPMARRLYHEAAAGEPVIDYHCHLPPADIAADRRFTDLASLWLGENGYGDHYKWRVMRANGVAENLITGNAEPWDRFAAWSATVPRLVGNPLYHWTHLELRRYFDVDEILNEKSAPAIWKAANDRLKNDPALSVKGILKKFRVAALATTDDPADSLEHHAALKNARSAGGTIVVPAFRPDKALNIEKPGFAEYVAGLGKAAGAAIKKPEDLLDALSKRIDFFHQLGCRASDHALDYLPWREPENLEKTFETAMEGKPVTGKADIESWKSLLLCYLARCYAEKGWAMQLHIQALRSCNTKSFYALGPDTGYDAVSTYAGNAENLARFLDYLNDSASVPKLIFYSLNSADWEPAAAVLGCFQGNGEGTAGKLQLGAAWWFLDHIDGMERQMRTLANTGLLSRFVGMLTDSRSFLSYPRHEYFRRILCRLLGGWAEAGEIPADMELLSGMVRDISFRNAKNYFGFEGL